MRRALLVLATACGSPGPTSNTLVTPNSAITVVAAPHVEILVRNASGLHRVWLDTAKTELVDDSRTATPLTDDAYVAIENERFVVVRKGQPRVTIPDVDTTHPIAIAHDGTQFAVEQPRDEAAVIAVADGSVRRVPLEPRVARYPRSFVFAKDGASLLVADEAERYRVELATGTRTPVDALEWQVNAPPSPSDCSARGLRLERRVRGRQQALVLVTLASARSPEELPSLGDRVVVSATNHPRLLPLEIVMFTPACDHVVFTLDERVYVANIATGQHAFLMRGVPVSLHRE